MIEKIIHIIGAVLLFSSYSVIAVQLRPKNGKPLISLFGQGRYPQPS